MAVHCAMTTVSQAGRLDKIQVINERMKLSKIKTISKRQHLESTNLKVNPVQI